MTTYHPRSRFVLDRLQETSWNNRDYIANLMILEEYALRGGPKSFAEGMQHHTIRRKYPVEANCIVRELRHGGYTPPLEFGRLMREHENVEQAERRRCAQLRQEEKCRAKEALAEKRQRWLELGGRA